MELTKRCTFSFIFIFSIVLLAAKSSAAASSIHDLLKSMGLPAGLLPKEVKSYDYASDSGLLEVFLDGPCLTKFDTMAFYESEFRANLSRGSLAAVEGLSQEELFLWLPVKDIIVDDPSSGLILIDIGLAHKQLSLALFEEPRDCSNATTSGRKHGAAFGFERESAAAARNNRAFSGHLLPFLPFTFSI